ncbi:hypothetical protein ACFRAE_17410 [Sphingobacterium sp. HJSM2_6]|uniref:hypothetical protein n=1 Tax=Sphingobacterium sp. HJSM2_6 TaxID=3366264 RepID=UPI003BE8A1E4
MAKSIYDVLNTVDLYVKITESIYSKNTPFWDEIVDVQKKVISILSNIDLKATMMKEIIEASDDVYSNLNHLFKSRKVKLLKLIDVYDIKRNECLFKDIFIQKKHFLEKLYHEQIKRTTKLRQEYESYDDSLDSAFYGLSDEEYKIFKINVEKEKKILKPNLDREIEKLDQLYTDQYKFIHDNTRYIASNHSDLLSYIEDLQNDSFIRKPLSRVNNEHEDLILNGSLLPNSNVFDNIYTELADDVFEHIERNSFVNIFQGHHSKIKLKIKKGNIQNVYFILYNLSESFEKDVSKNWLEHVINYIEWGDAWTLENVLEKIRKKRKDASKELKDKLARLIYIDPKESK